MDQLPTTHVTFENVTFNTSTLFGGVDYRSGSGHYFYEQSRTLYIPLLHGLVMIAGLVVNMYMIITLHCACRKDSARRVSDLEVSFTQLGVCNMATLLTLPVWVTQTIFVKGWVFGYLVCKLMTGVMTFSFEYGIFIMSYINIERYMKVVNNRTTLKGWFAKKRSSSRRRIVSRLCACLPALSALLDICYYTIRPISKYNVMCFNGMHHRYQLVTFWIRITVCFFIPILILLYCNSMIVYTVREHVNHLNRNFLGVNMKRAQVLPFLTVTLFICCWIPWIVSAICYRRRTKYRDVEYEEIRYVVLNVCTAIGNMYCITSPTLFIVMRRRKTLTSVHQRTDTPRFKRAVTNCASASEERSIALPKSDENCQGPPLQRT